MEKWIRVLLVEVAGCGLTSDPFQSKPDWDWYYNMKGKTSRVHPRVSVHANAKMEQPFTAKGKTKGGEYLKKALQSWALSTSDNFRISLRLAGGSVGWAAWSPSVCRQGDSGSACREKRAYVRDTTGTSHQVEVREPTGASEKSAEEPGGRAEGGDRRALWVPEAKWRCFKVGQYLHQGGGAFVLTFLIHFVSISELRTESQGNTGDTHPSLSLNEVLELNGLLFKNKTPIKALLIKTTHFTIKYVKTKRETKYFPANCVKHTHTQAWPTYVYSICKTGPLPQALWMSDKSLLLQSFPVFIYFSCSCLHL